MRVLRFGAAILLLALAQPAEAQYRRRTQERLPLYALSVSAGALLPYEETTKPVQPPEPEENRRGLRDVGASPWVSLSARYGRGIAIYASVAAGRGGDAELSGFDAMTGDTLQGTTETGTLSMYSGGVSFAPLRIAQGLRIEGGPTWIDLGTGGSYLALRLAAAASFFAIGDRGRVFVGWDGYFAGDQHDRDGVEYQIRSGHIMALRAGFEYAW